MQGKGDRNYQLYDDAGQNKSVGINYPRGHAPQRDSLNIRGHCRVEDTVRKIVMEAAIESPGLDTRYVTRLRRRWIWRL